MSYPSPIEQELSVFVTDTLKAVKPDLVVCSERKATAIVRALLERDKDRLPLTWDRVVSTAALSAFDWDELGAGVGDRISLSEGPEAAQPFRPELKPVDAYNSAILDHVDLRPLTLRRRAAKRVPDTFSGNTKGKTKR